MAYPHRLNARRSNSATVPLSPASSVIVTEFPGRLELTIVNNSANDVSLKLRVSAGVGTPSDPTAVLGEGIVLKANGGSWTTQSYSGPVAATAATGAVSVAVTEI